MLSAPIVGDHHAMSSTTFDLIVIGAGPGGYIASIRAAQLGLSVACIEKEDRLGGTCLRVGCIPSKALLESSELFHEAKDGFDRHGIAFGDVKADIGKMMARKDGIVKTLTSGIDGLFKKHKIQRFLGAGRFVARGKVAVLGADGAVLHELSGRNILVATGSVSAPLKGVELDGDIVGTSTEALSWPAVPKHLVVVGAGAIGLEMGSVWARLGAKVTVLEYSDRPLAAMDGEVSALAKKLFEKQGIVFKLGVKVLGARRAGAGAVVEVEGQPSIECDRVLLAVGRRPNTDGLALEAVGLKLDERGRIPVDHHFRTQALGVYAIGDVVRGAMLAHKAEEEGVACAEFIATGHCHVNYDAIPNVVYTSPEIASVGKTEEELKAAGVPYKKGSFPFMANARARALGHTDGFVKILAHKETDRILGGHIIGPRAGDLIAEVAMAMEFGSSSEDVARTCHAHPTLSEVVKEAALAVDGRALNI
jgi:dihydrolipoamide dehydrogenase